MKIVLDTNVLVSGIFWGGYPAKVVDLWRSKKIKLVGSESILDEYLKTIQWISEKLERSDLHTEWVRVLPSNISIISVKKSFRLCRDPDDDKFIDCAIASRARYIVSGDKDLLVLNRIMNITILRPKQFLEKINQ